MRSRPPFGLLLAIALVEAHVASTAASIAASTARAAGAGGAAGETSVEDWRCERKVCQRVVRRGAYLNLELENRRARATWVVLEPEGLVNVKPLQATPFIVRLEPGERKSAGLLGIQDVAKPFAHASRWRALVGNPKAVHDDRWHYRMPFGGHSMIPISQGYNGKFSHKGLGAYALDFPMPWGTPILAARGGTIVEVINDKVASGIRTGESEGDNRVVIEHVDGTFAIYAHLRHGGPARVGQRVLSGELIGLSGDTGFSTGPHLHFQVYTIRPDGQYRTIPVKFWNGTPAGFTAIAGLEYKPGCPRDGGSMCMPGELAGERGLEWRPEASTATASPAPSAASAPASSAAAPATGAASDPLRRADGACACRNGAVLHVDLPCALVCGR